MFRYVGEGEWENITGDKSGSYGMDEVDAGVVAGDEDTVVGAGS